MGLSLCRRVDDTGGAARQDSGEANAAAAAAESERLAALARDRLAKRSRRVRKYKTLAKVLSEVVESERKYIDFLCVLSDVYYEPMKKHAKSLRLSVSQLATVCAQPELNSH